MMKQIFCLALALCLVAVASAAAAQQPEKVPRIGYLSAPDPAQLSPPVPREFGWLCASLATSRDRTSPSSTDMRRGRLDRLPELAAELVRLKVDIIVVSRRDPRSSRRPRMRPRRFPS